MRKILSAFLFVISTAAWAEWVKIDENASFNVYVEPPTIKRIGSARRVWVIYDLKAPHGQTRSLRVFEEFDCNERRSRVISNSGHSGQMAKGGMLFSNDSPSKWADIAPDSPSEVRLKIVCSK